MLNYSPIFPCNNDKRPLTTHGFKDASDDPKVIEKWEKTFKNIAYWGFPTGNGLFVIDVDNKNGGTGIKNWKKMTQCHGEPDTYTVKTRSGGFHYYFYMPSGTTVKNSASQFADGIDIRGEGGYVITPDGVDYEVYRDAEVMYPPLWILEKLNIGVKPQPQSVWTGRESYTLPKTIKNGTRNSTLFSYGRSLRAKNVTENEIWKKMQEANEKHCETPIEADELHQIYQSVLTKPAGVTGFQIKSEGIPQAGRNPLPEDYRKAMIAMGYSFKLDLVDNSVYINGHPMNDIDEQELLFNLGNAGFGSRDKAVQAYTYEAKQHEFHPIQEYLKNLKWDGQDHIAKLASYFTDEEGVFAQWIRKWLIGSVAKVLPTPHGYQNRTLVLAGNQNAGKSFFVRWLASEVPDFHMEKSINPEDKDDYLRKINSWIWEVAELGATTRKADIEALKNFQSMEKVTVRKSYGRYDLNKPALANFIATVNNEGTGFLNDPTGNRRYMTCTIQNIDWSYAQEVSVSQVWAQAVALFENGEDWNLSDSEAQQATEVNNKYEVDNTVGQYISRLFDIDTNETDWIMPTTEIIDFLQKKVAVGYTERAISMHISKYLTTENLKKVKVTPKGYTKRVWCWVGIQPKEIDSTPPQVVRTPKHIVHKMPDNQEEL